MLRKPLMLHSLHEVHWKPRILFWPSTNCTFCNLWRRRFGFQLYFCSCWCCWELLLRTNLLFCYEVHVCTYRNTYRICYFVSNLRCVTCCELHYYRSGLQVGRCICVFIVLLFTGDHGYACEVSNFFASHIVFLLYLVRYILTSRMQRKKGSEFLLVNCGF